MSYNIINIENLQSLTIITNIIKVQNFSANHRDLTELVALFGQTDVDDAIAHELAAGQYAFDNPEALAKASAALRNALYSSEETVAYIASLNRELKRALIVAIMNA